MPIWIIFTPFTMIKGCIRQEWFLIKDNVLYFFHLFNWIQIVLIFIIRMVRDHWSPKKWVYNADYTNILKNWKAFICKKLNIWKWIIEFNFTTVPVIDRIAAGVQDILNFKQYGAWKFFRYLYMIRLKNLTENIIMNKIGSKHLQWKMHSIELLSETFGSCNCLNRTVDIIEM